MEKIIATENIRNFAYVNDSLCKNIKGVIIRFFGLGLAPMYDTDTEDGIYYAKKDILYVVPYYNPWSWMNKQTVTFVDEVIDVLTEKHNLPKDIPFVFAGGSMGGLSSLVYSVYSKRKPVSCVINCPVCDAVYHYSERHDVPKTLYSALYTYAGTLEEALKSISPMHLIEKMPKIEYHFFHGTADDAVNIDAHTRKFVAELQKRNFDVTFDIIEGRGHGELTPEMKQKFLEYPAMAIEKTAK